MGKNNDNSCNENTASKELASCLFLLPPKQFSLLSSIIGILLIDELDLGEQNSLGNFIVSIGQTILTAAAQGQLLQDNNSQNDDAAHEIEALKKQLSELEKKLKN
jgi:hypothetical protein